MRRRESWLLVLSFPIIVPSLIVNFLMAKRWGRNDFALIAFDGLALTMLSLRSAIFFLLVLVAWLASGMLWILRRDKLPYGIFLGYSNSIAWRLIAGGLLVLLGTIRLVPWTLYARISDVLASEQGVTAGSIADNRVHGLRPVLVKDGAFDWDRRAYRTPTSSGARFYPSDPRSPSTVVSASELWEQRQTLVGMPVSLDATPGAAYLRTDVEYDRVPGGAREGGQQKQGDSAQRLYAPVRGTGGRVWLLSEAVGGRSDPAALAFMGRRTHAGTLVNVYSDAALAREYASDDGQPLPYMGVGIRPEAFEAQVGPLETWVPLTGTDETVWVAFPSGLDSEPGGPVRGIYLGAGAPAVGLLEHIRTRFQKTATLRDPHVIAGVGRLEYLARERLASQFFAAIGWGALIILLPGIGLIAWASWLAAEE